MPKPLVSALDDEALEHNIIAESFRHHFEPTYQKYLIDNESPPSLPFQFEHLDHTADLQIHSWGNTLSEALSCCVYGLSSYMADISKVSLKQMKIFYCPGRKSLINVSVGASPEDLAYRLLCESLNLFHESLFLIRHIELKFVDKNSYSLVAAW
ncbi:Protein archease [Mitosporidium daphniae]|uniref:Archease domain-containing protein n=1 Tax=Mitosporidium daphniae TaxID=1485682 RepID=A0A098VLJ3_9MICR|nr:uncharacterized protein DI09_9p110 [Mitosporidium daphniae]KGG49928.1 hypothetical protein DI09_9p110 [Mitosporidium daphniae]|eukprot:XP_013236355.1 uncharacterized protein DI09_9p110 [Mitosporidium daphniae]